MTLMLLTLLELLDILMVAASTVSRTTNFALSSSSEQWNMGDDTSIIIQILLFIG